MKKSQKPRTLNVELHCEVWQPAFTAELTALIRKYGIEAEENYPASLLSSYFLMCINTLRSMEEQRKYYYRIGWHPEGIPQEVGMREESVPR